MGQGARVTSLDAVAEMSAAVQTFRFDASTALDGLDMEIRRALEWIHNDRREHWDREVRRDWERISEARVQLQQAMTARRIDERDPSCVDEKKTLERAKRHLDVAQRKVEAVRHWTNAIDRAVNEYRAARAQMTSWLEIDAPRAVSTLSRLMESLEAYVGMDMPVEQVIPLDSSAGEQSASRGGPPTDSPPVAPPQSEPHAPEEPQP